MEINFKIGFEESEKLKKLLFVEIYTLFLIYLYCMVFFYPCWRTKDINKYQSSAYFPHLRYGLKNTHNNLSYN